SGAAASGRARRARHQAARGVVDDRAAQLRDRRPQGQREGLHAGRGAQGRRPDMVQPRRRPRAAQRFAGRARRVRARRPAHRYQGAGAEGDRAYQGRAEADDAGPRAGRAHPGDWTGLHQMKARTVVFWLHLITGTTAGAVILVMAATGVLLTFAPQMVEWAER